MSNRKRLFGAVATAMLCAGGFVVVAQKSSPSQAQPAVLKPEQLKTGTYLIIIPEGKTASLDLPKGAEIVKVSEFGGQGMFHNGNRQDKKDPTPCMGPIRQWLNDDGQVLFECGRCGKKWPPRPKG